MSIQMACPFCERPHKVDNKYAGKRILCKRCGKAIRVPQLGAAAAPGAVASPAPAPRVATRPGVTPIATTPPPEMVPPGAVPGVSPEVVAPPMPMPVEVAKDEPAREPATETEPAASENAMAGPLEIAEAVPADEPAVELPVSFGASTVEAPRAEMPAPPAPPVTATNPVPAEMDVGAANEAAEIPAPPEDQLSEIAAPIAANTVTESPPAPPSPAEAAVELPDDIPASTLLGDAAVVAPLQTPNALDGAPSMISAAPEEPAPEVSPAVAPEAVEAPTAPEPAREALLENDPAPPHAETPPVEEPPPEEEAAPEIVRSGPLLLTVPAHMLPTSEHIPGDSPAGLAGRKAMGPPLGPGAIYLKEIMLHLNRTVGRVVRVFHERIPSNTPIDLHVVVPSHYATREAHPYGNSFFTVITSGLSNHPMNLPAGAPAAISPYAELMVCLPMTWLGMTMDGLFDLDAMRDEKNWWPMRWLKAAARMPHEHNTFLAPGHLIPNGPALSPAAPDTRLGCMLVMPSALHPTSHRLVVNEKVAIDFYALWPLYPEEFQCRQERGLEELLRRFAESGITELVLPRRKNVAAANA